MGISFRFLLLAAAFQLVPAVWAQSAPLAQASNPPFSVSISLEQDVLKAGSEVRLDIVLTNISDENTVISGWEDQSCEIYEIEIHDSGGKRLPKRNECLPFENRNQTTVCVSASSPAIRTCVPQNQVLKPHGEMKEKILLNELYDLSRPGKYTIQAQRPRTSRTAVESNTVKLTIEPSPPQP